MISEFRYFLKSNFVAVNWWFVLVYSNHNADCERFKTQWYCLPKDIIKNYNAIINGKNLW